MERYTVAPLNWREIMLFFGVDFPMWFFSRNIQFVHLTLRQLKNARHARLSIRDDILRDARVTDG